MRRLRIYALRIQQARAPALRYALPMASQQSDLELRAVEGFAEYEIGAPMPMVIGSEDALVLFYIAGVADPAWVGRMHVF